MKINIFRGDVTNMSAKKEALVLQARSQPYFDKLKAQYDETQLEAIECCASLVATPEQVQVSLGSLQVLPVVLIQGPPGTGKTHTVKVCSSTFVVKIK